MRRANLMLPTIAVALLVVATGGCGGKGGNLEQVEVSGTITYNGKAVEGATVTFLNTAGSSDSATGKTDASGKYVFKAAVGTNQVAVVKVKAGGGEQSPDGAMGQMMNKMGGGGPDSQNSMKSMSTSNNHELPIKYSNPANSGLSASVSSSGNNVFDFDLSGEAGGYKQGGGGGGGGP